MLVKTNLDDFYRDVQSNAIINTNVEKIRQYKQQRESLMKMQNLASDVEMLKQDMSEIKSMLQLLVRDNNGATNK
jgi:hypothetical protein